MPMDERLQIQCAGEDLELFADRAVWWKRTRTLIIADPHFGKPAAFRRAGIPVPENTTATDLARLDQLIARTGSERLIILGDFFHAPSGRSETTMQSLAEWCARQAGTKIALVSGNHDLKSGEPPGCWNFQVIPTGFRDGPFWMTHAPSRVRGAYVLAGHLHPAISLHERYGAGIRAACYCFGADRAILPAFGSFTGVHPIRPEEDDRIFAIGEGELIEVETKDPLKKFRMIRINPPSKEK